MASTAIAELEQFGVKVAGKRMDNGEFRFSLMDGQCGYVLTKMPQEGGGWQNAHYHKGLRETYIVQSGFILFAERREGKTNYSIAQRSNVFTTEPGVPHNVYVYPGTSFHTVKHGTPVGNPEKKGNDWWPADPAFDAETKACDGARDIGCYVMFAL